MEAHEGESKRKPSDHVNGCYKELCKTVVYAVVYSIVSAWCDIRMWLPIVHWSWWNAQDSLILVSAASTLLFIRCFFYYQTSVIALPTNHYIVISTSYFSG